MGCPRSRGLDPQGDDFLSHCECGFRRGAISHRTGKVWDFYNPGVIWLTPIEAHAVLIHGVRLFQ
jgi:hypothetical protein